MNTRSPMAEKSENPAPAEPRLRWFSFMENRITKHALFCDHEMIAVLVQEQGDNWACVPINGPVTWHGSFVDAVQRSEAIALRTPAGSGNVELLRKCIAGLEAAIGVHAILEEHGKWGCDLEEWEAVHQALAAALAEKGGAA